MHKIFFREIYQNSTMHTDNTLDLSNRIELVLSVYKDLGYINRQALINVYGITQRQAGALMRDFIHAHASKIQWNKDNFYFTLMQ